MLSGMKRLFFDQLPSFVVANIVVEAKAGKIDHCRAIHSHAFFSMVELNVDMIVERLAETRIGIALPPAENPFTEQEVYHLILMSVICSEAFVITLGCQVTLSSSAMYLSQMKAIVESRKQVIQENVSSVMFR